LTFWGHHGLGAGLSVNGYALDLTGHNPPKPKQNKRYERVERAITNLGHSLDNLQGARDNLRVSRDTAKRQHDGADARAIQKRIDDMNDTIHHVKGEINRLKVIYTNARHS
jgi:chromosome segregation ATPase